MDRDPLTDWLDRDASFETGDRPSGLSSGPGREGITLEEDGTGSEPGSGQAGWPSADDPPAGPGPRPLPDPGPRPLPDPGPRPLPDPGPRPLPDPGSRRRLALFAVLPWAVALALVVLRGPASSEGGGAQPDDPPPPASTQPGSTPVITTGDGRIPPVAPQSPAEEALGAAAALAVRQAVTRPPGGGRPAVYVDLALPESVRRDGNLRVVTVLALVLGGDGTAWRTSQVVRYAVAFPADADDARPVPVTKPWPVAAIDATADPGPEWQPSAADPDPVVTALEAASFTEVTDVRLFTSGALPDVQRAAFRGVGPGQPRPDRHDVVLTAGRDARVVSDDGRKPVPDHGEPFP